MLYNERIFSSKQSVHSWNTKNLQKIARSVSRLKGNMNIPWSGWIESAQKICKEHLIQKKKQKWTVGSWRENRPLVANIAEGLQYISIICKFAKVDLSVPFSIAAQPFKIPKRNWRLLSQLQSLLKIHPWPLRRGSCTCSTWTATPSRRTTWPSRRRTSWTGWRNLPGSSLETSKLLFSQTGRKDFLTISLPCHPQVQLGLSSLSQWTFGTWLVHYYITLICPPNFAWYVLSVSTSNFFCSFVHIVLHFSLVLIIYHKVQTWLVENPLEAREFCPVFGKDLISSLHLISFTLNIFGQDLI